MALLIGGGMWLLATRFPWIGFDFPERRLVAGLIALVGGLIDVTGVVTFLRARTSVNPLRPEKASAVVSAGIFGITRNPMYVGLLFVLTGWFVYLGAWSAIVGPIGFVAYIHRFQILPEERALAAKFGEEYRAYLARVRRWL
ncbi:MAG TPA: isoprenylcysteine carboxylmethyltransferase family protein [Burkholderiales bacterium]|nr:isoprenylcysteine carboxylmethyltransferase family protein [Burkholderiales bacterium]